MNDKKTEHPLYLWIIVIVLAVIAVCIVVWFGSVLEITSAGSTAAPIIKLYNAFSKLNKYVGFEYFINAIIMIRTGTGTTRKAFILSMIASALGLLYFKNGNGKRYHKKGIEHGSAKWGSQREKNIIADTTKAGFYNNVIAASDVFLVLDRKQCEINEHGEKKEKEKKKSAEKGKKNDADNTELSVAQVRNRKNSSGKIKPMLNLNMLILGGSGTGKSRYFVKPNLLQCNTSYVVTDPSGELLQSCGKMLERMGYKIKVFNINDMKHSSNYNPFHYLKGHDEKINNNNVIKMINVFMMNTKGEGQSGDPFWDDATRLLLSAICFLLVETADEDEQNFSKVLDLIHKAKVVEDKPDEKSELDFIFEEHKQNDPKALSCQYYDEFKQAAGKTMQSILISTTTKLQHFKLEDMRNLTFTDNIHLETLGDEKQALFIIIPSSDTTFNFLAAMMYTQLFDILYDRAINYYHGRLPVHVRFILDEFANCGKIPEFEKILATCRKFEISAQIILQNLSQLKRLYEKSWEELPGNTDTVIYLGGKDQSTNEYISKELGKETIDTLSINKTKSKQGSTSYNDGILGRELATIDELGTMDNNDCIVMVRGLHPFFTHKFDIVNHPRYSMLDEADRENNTYYLEESLDTLKETEYVSFEDFFDDDKNADAENIVEIVFVSGTQKMSREEMAISDKLKDLTEIYAA